MATASDPTPAATPDTGARFVGMATRVVSWVIDALIINLVAIILGLGVQLVLSIFPLSPSAHTPFEAIAGAAYVLWTAVYFIGFWSTTGQTPGARIMLIRQVTADRRRVKPVRALVRWVGMNLAMLPLFAGYLPVAFGRRGFPDWLARTLVVEAPQLSMAAATRASLRSARGARRRPPAVLPEPTPSSPGLGDGRSQPQGGAPRASAPV